MSYKKWDSYEFSLLEGNVYEMKYDQESQGMGVMKHFPRFHKETGRYSGEIFVSDFVKHLKEIKYFGIVTITPKSTLVLFDNLYVRSEVYCKRNILANLPNPCYKAKTINQSLSETSIAVCSNSSIDPILSLTCLTYLFIVILLITTFP